MNRVGGFRNLLGGVGMFKSSVLPERVICFTSFGIDGHNLHSEIDTTNVNPRDTQLAGLPEQPGCGE